MSKGKEESQFKSSEINKYKKRKVNLTLRVQKKLDRLNSYRNEYILISNKENDTDRIVLKHTECGNTITFTYDYFNKIKKIGCGNCEIKDRTNAFKEKLKLKFKNHEEFEVLGKYINARTFIKMKHSKCGLIYEMKPKSILDKGLKCPICCNQNKKTTQKYKSEVFDLTKGEFLVLGEYVDYKTKILIKRVKCKHVFYAKPSEFLKKPHCHVCLKKRRALEKHNNLVTNFNKKFKGEYEVVTQIYNTTGVVDLLHNKCGHLFTTTYNKAMKQNIKVVCPKCNKDAHDKKLEWRKKNFLEKAYNRWLDEYEYIGDYKSQDTEMLVRHSKCNTEFYISPRKILYYKNICPKCNKI